MDEKKGTGVDLLTAKDEAKKKMQILSEEELDLVNGGAAGFINCPKCNAQISASYHKCPYCRAWTGDERDMNEELADVAGLTADVDGFAE